MRKKPDYYCIVHQIHKRNGGDNSAEMYIFLKPKDEKDPGNVVVSLTVNKRFKLKDIDKAEELYQYMDTFNYNLDVIAYGTSTRGNKKK